MYTFDGSSIILPSNIISYICFPSSSHLPYGILQLLFMCLRRGAIVTTFIVCYALTSFISGYVSGGMYSRNGGKHFDH
jgi:hypothetical protein